MLSAALVCCFFPINTRSHCEIQEMRAKYIVAILLVALVAADHGGGKRGGGGNQPAPSPPLSQLHNKTAHGNLHNRSNSTTDDHRFDGRPGPHRPHNIDNSLRNSKAQAAQNSLAQLLHDGGRPNIAPRLPDAGAKLSDHHNETDKSSHLPRSTPLPPSGDIPGGRPRPHGADAQ